jgi:hypothetical protein
MIKKVWIGIYTVGGVLLMYSFIIQPTIKHYYHVSLPYIHMAIPMGIIFIALIALRIHGDKEAIAKQTDESPK